MHLLRPKMSRQLSIVDLIQQYLPTRRWHHQSRLLFCALKDQFKPVFGHNMKLSMIPTYALLVNFLISTSEGSYMCPDKYMPKKMLPQLTIKQRLRHDLQ